MQKVGVREGLDIKRRDIIKFFKNCEHSLNRGRYRDENTLKSTKIKVMENREERREEIREEKREERREERHNHHLPNQTAEDILANGKRHHNHNTGKINRLWLWLGVIILIFILGWWLWTICIAEDVTGVDNGTVSPQQTVQMILPLLGF